MQEWDGTGLSQAYFMHNDECIVLDEQDRIIGHENKYNCHKFNMEKVFYNIILDFGGSCLQLCAAAKRRVTQSVLCVSL
jgi:isopentenyldiphosphate isomerase